MLGSLLANPGVSGGGQYSSSASGRSDTGDIAHRFTTDVGAGSGGAGNRGQNLNIVFPGGHLAAQEPINPSGMGIIGSMGMYTLIGAAALVGIFLIIKIKR